MGRAHRRRRSTIPFTLLVVLVLLATARNAAAQAWVPLVAGRSASLPDIATPPRTNGFLVERGQSINRGLYIEGDYALTDRFSVSAGLPYVFAKYTATLPPAPPIPYPPGDQCHCWNSGWQDFGFTARYNVVGGAFSLTTSLSAGVPSRGYDYRGEAVVGRNLREVRIAVDAGQRLDAISPRLSVQGRYSYAFVERVIDTSQSQQRRRPRFADKETAGAGRCHGSTRMADWFRIATASEPSLPGRRQHPGASG
jgi:hypothetical protein